MKIASLYDFLREIGGLERVMFFHANILKEKNDISLVFSYVSEKEKEKILRELGLEKGINYLQIGKSKSQIIEYALSLLFPSRIKKIKADLMISHSFMCSNMAYKKKKMNKTPYIIIMHHPPNFLYNRNLKWVNNVPRFFAYFLGLIAGPLLKRIDIKAVKNADIVIVSSKYTQRRIKNIYNIEPVVIYPPVSKSFVLMKENKARKILEKFKISEKFVLLHGRMIKDKRPDLAVKAFSKVLKSQNSKSFDDYQSSKTLKSKDFNDAQKSNSKKISDIKKDVLLVVSGTIEEEKKIKSLIKELGIERKVKIVGRVSEEELVALYNSASCFIMSAPKEDFGLTPIEAMSCGTPVVAWKDGAGPEETVIHGVNGFFAKPYDINDMAGKIEKVLDKKWDREKIRKSIEKFSETRIKKEFLKIIDSLSSNNFINKNPVHNI